MNHLSGTVRDETGVIVSGASIYIYAPDGTLATVKTAGGVVTTNPRVSDSLGYWDCYVDADGYYTVKINYGGRLRYVEANVLAGTAPLQSVIDAATDGVADVEAAGTAQVAAVAAEGGVQIALAEAQADIATAQAVIATTQAGIATTKASEASASATSAASAVAAVANGFQSTTAHAAIITALKDTTALEDWTRLSWVDTSSNNTATTNGETWVGRDVGTDTGWTTGTVIDAIAATIGVAADAVYVQARLWECATADANVNSAPPQAGDTLISDVTLAISGLEPMDGGTTGLTAGTASRPMVFPLQYAYTLQASKTYKMSWKALQTDGSTETNIIIATRSASPSGRQRWHGGYRSSAGGSFTTLSTSLQRAVGVLRRNLISLEGVESAVTANTAAITALSQRRLAWMLRSNDATLAEQAALLNRTLSDNVTDSGDSLISNNTDTSGQNATYAMAPYVDAGISPTITIANAGQDGTPGSYPLVFSGGTGLTARKPEGFFIVGSSGSITAVFITERGSGYATAPTISVSACPGIKNSSNTALALTTLLTATLVNTLNNLGQSGTRSDEIRAVFTALSAGQQNDPGVTNGGTNDFAQKASSVLSATITAGGSGGTDGTYTVSTTGGVNNVGTSVGLVQASYSVTVSGGAITAATPIGIGGGFYTLGTAPTFDLSGIPGLGGATLTPVLDIFESVKANIGAIMAAGGSKRIYMGPWTANGATQWDWGMARKTNAWGKTTYGARFFDGLAFLAMNHGGSETSLSGVRVGQPPAGLLSDSLHPNDAGTAILGRERARMIRAVDGIGPAYHHSDLWGAKNGDASGTAIGTIRTLGTFRRVAIIDGGTGDAARLDSSTGAITRGAGTLPAITELFVQSEAASGKGRSNISRQVIVRKMDGTTPNKAVRFRGTDISVMSTPGLTGGGLSKKGTLIVAGRYRNATACGFMTSSPLSGGDSQWLTKQARGLRFFCRNSSNSTIANVTTPTTTNDQEWAVFFFSFDTTSGVQILKGTVNEETANTAVPSSADAQMNFGNPLYIGGSAGSPLVGFDIRMIWLAQDYFDIADTAVRALFYNSTTKEPLDLGASGIVSGVTPLLYLRGMAGDWQMGANYGSGGDLNVPPYISADQMQFTDV